MREYNNLQLLTHVEYEMFTSKHLLIFLIGITLEMETISKTNLRSLSNCLLMDQSCPCFDSPASSPARGIHPAKINPAIWLSSVFLTQFSFSLHIITLMVMLIFGFHDKSVAGHFCSWSFECFWFNLRTLLINDPHPDHLKNNVINVLSKEIEEEPVAHCRLFHHQLHALRLDPDQHVHADHCNGDGDEQQWTRWFDPIILKESKLRWQYRHRWLKA